MTARHATIPMDDGATLHAIVHDGDGPAVLLLHDLDCSSTYWDAVVARLRQLDPDLLIVQLDLRGHGESTIVEEASRKRLVKDVKRVTKALGLHEPVLCGHGWGADIALACDHAGSVVAVNPLMGRAPGLFEGDVERPEHMAGARDEAALRSCLVGASTAKPLRRGRRDAPLLLVHSQRLDAEALLGTDVLEAAHEVMAWQDASRHLPIEAPAGVAALLWSWIEETV